MTFMYVFPDWPEKRMAQPPPEHISVTYMPPEILAMGLTNGENYLVTNLTSAPDDLETMARAEKLMEEVATMFGYIVETRYYRLKETLLGGSVGGHEGVAFYQPDTDNPPRKGGKVT